MNRESLVKPENFSRSEHPSEESRHSYCEADIPKAKATIRFSNKITNVGENPSLSRVTILHDPMLGLSVPVDDHNPEARRKGPRFLDIQRRAWPPRHHQKWRISTTRRQPNTQQRERAKTRASQIPPVHQRNQTIWTKRTTSAQSCSKILRLYRKQQYRRMTTWCLLDFCTRHAKLPFQDHQLDPKIHQNTWQS